MLKRWARIGSAGCYFSFGTALPDDTNPYVHSNHIGLQGACVSNLISINSNIWDRDIVDEMFKEWDKELIYSILLGVSVCRDEWYWKEESYGDYSEKSAYNCYRERIIGGTSMRIQVHPEESVEIGCPNKD